MPTEQLKSKKRIVPPTIMPNQNVPIEQSKPKKRSMASTIMPKSPVRDINAPILHKVATEIIVDDRDFIPNYSDLNASAVDIKAYFDSKEPSQRRVALGHRAIVVLNCGFELKLAPGYKAVIKVLPALANRGLMVADGHGIVDGSSVGNVCVTVTNVGKEIVAICHGDVFAQMWIEPVYLFDFVQKIRVVELI